MEDIKNVAAECINCKTKPCQKGCPLSNDTTGFIQLMKEEKYKAAYELLCNTTVLQPICGRICPHTKQCQGNCIRNNIKDCLPVSIGKLEAFLGDLAIKNNWAIPTFTNIKNGKKVAVIGGGPSGLTCAAFLSRYGFDVTIYEKYNYLGGIISHSIPDFRLDKNIVKNTINKILDLGIDVKYNMELGKDFCIEDIEDNYDAIFISFGKNISSKMNIPGEEIKGVYGGNELLEYKSYPDFEDKNIAVIGGGNVAIDIARTVKRLNANNVTIIYRRNREEMPAEQKEIEIAEQEGINFMFQTNILKILGDKQVEKIECIKTKLVTKEGENRKVPINIENSNFKLNIDYVIMAIGSKLDENLKSILNLNNNNIFISSELINTKGSIAWAARSGRDGAEQIKEYLI